MAPSSKSQLSAQRSNQLAHMVTVGRYRQHQDAQAAVDLLAEAEFPVENLSIVGVGLRQVEHIVGRVSYGRAAASGALQGLFYGAMMALLLSAVGGDALGVALMTAIPLGIAFWMIMSVVGLSRRGSRRFAAVGQIVSENYELLCTPQEAQQARALLGGPTGSSTFRPDFRQQQGPGPQQQHGAGPGQYGQPEPWQGGQQPGGYGQQPGGYGQPGPYGQAGPQQAGPQQAGPQQGAGGAAGAASGQPGWGAGPQGGSEGTEAAPAAPRRSQAADYQDLPDGRPRYGIRVEPQAQPGTQAHGGDPTQQGDLTQQATQPTRPTQGHQDHNRPDHTGPRAD